MLKKSFVLVLMLVFCSALQAEKLDYWVIDGFENYNTTNDMLAGSFSHPLLPLVTDPPITEIPTTTPGGTGPWYDMGYLREILATGTPTINFDIGLVIGDQNGVNDPNGFTAVREVDVDGPRAMEITPLTTDWNEVMILAADTGLPTHDTPINAEPFITVPCVDFTQWDYLSIKLNNRSGNVPWEDAAIEFLFIGPDLGAMAWMEADRVYYEPKGIFAQATDTWLVIEFAIPDSKLEIGHNLEQPPDGSNFDMTDVYAFGFGSIVQASGETTFAIDEIAVYRESDGCDEYVAGDVNLDCTVDLSDVSKLAADWLK